MVTMTHGHPETNRCLWRLLFCVFLDRVLLSEGGVFSGVEAPNHHLEVTEASVRCSPRVDRRKLWK